jgi:hypothetical protein
MFFGTLTAFNRLIDRGERVGGLPSTAQGFRCLTQKVVKRGIGLAEVVEAGAQQLQSAGDIAAPDGENSLKAKANSVPDRQ